MKGGYRLCGRDNYTMTGAININQYIMAVRQVLHYAYHHNQPRHERGDGGEDHWVIIFLYLSIDKRTYIRYTVFSARQ